METIGASSKKEENTEVFIVAEEMMIFRSFLSLIISFNRPKMKSIFRLRSWASSTIMTL